MIIVITPPLIPLHHDNSQKNKQNVLKFTRFKSAKQNVIGATDDNPYVNAITLP